MHKRYLSIGASLIAVAAMLSTAAPVRAQSDDSSAKVSATSDAIPGTPSATSDDLSVPAEPDWNRVEGADAGSNGNDDNQVLELPQVADPNQAATAGSSNAQNGAEDSAKAPDEVGNVDDYENQSAMTATGVYAVPVPAQLGMNGLTPVPAPISPGLRTVPRMGGMAPLGTIMARPGGLGPFPATSLMLMPPRGSGAMPGGWWMRAH